MTTSPLVYVYIFWCIEFAFSVSNENLKERPSIPRIHVTSGILSELSSSLITGDKIQLIAKIGQGEEYCNNIL